MVGTVRNTEITGARKARVHFQRKERSASPIPKHTENKNAKNVRKKVFPNAVQNVPLIKNSPTETKVSVNEGSM